MLNSPSLTWIGVILFGTSTLFALITLPVEFNASARARQHLFDHGIVTGEEEVEGVRSVLNAAAWTYVAGAVSALGSWLFYLILLLGARGRREA
jgi:Zn-dependent membrane protease YugP